MTEVKEKRQPIALLLKRYRGYMRDTSDHNRDVSTVFFETGSTANQGNWDSFFFSADPFSPSFYPNLFVSTFIEYRINFVGEGRGGENVFVQLERGGTVTKMSIIQRIYRRDEAELAIQFIGNFSHAPPPRCTNYVFQRNASSERGQI